MLNLPSLEVPLVHCPDGGVRVDGTDVLLELIVADFEGGMIADEIANRHSGLTLSDVFLVLSFYLKHRNRVEEYLAKRNRGPRSRPKPAA